MSHRRAAPNHHALLTLLGIALLGTAVGCSSTEAAAPAGEGTIAFPRTPDPASAIAAAKLPALPAEGNVVHYHSHLDIVINGQPVVVPNDIGIAMNGISPLHTHDTTGIVHIEANQADTFTLAQLFTEWGVKLDASCIATYCTDDKNEFRAYQNGEAVSDPTTIAFDKHEEIFLWYGPKGTTSPVPASYTFTGGL